jgi:hypothetical protein
VRVRLECPLCGAVVVDGPEPEPGSCPGCRARYAGGADDAPGTVARALDQLGVEGLGAAELASGLFALDPDDPLALQVAITSDRREGFYRWWLFVREDGDTAAELLARVADTA